VLPTARRVPTPELPSTIDKTPRSESWKVTDASANSNLVKKQWGISFIKDSKWVINSDTGNQIKLIQNVGGASGDTMTIDFIAGNTVSDSDAKFGSVTYYYDSAKQSWMKIAQDEQSAGCLRRTHRGRLWRALG
jgi:hypothetical protein